MTLDNLNSENENIEQIDEQELQAITGGCQGCEAMSILGGLGMTKSSKLADKASTSYNAGRAHALANDFKYLQDSAAAHSSIACTSCSNHQDHFERFQSLKRRYNNLKGAIRNE